ncbi:aspartyl-phosphate phosphatase Spo0E family protein [Metabacillus halosaccharovorans]|uniref:Aspartyl-phosphate phosphatase Spo0E family protein n=2 Tax=Metabacillus halosaccharovorans TaxID=930124 RepID=A0ABT3DNQ8_9BACI|nr:aspartyl-phosphate phosphatase Spo0E family protein [Metabacillus halosaccharovorans]
MLDKSQNDHILDNIELTRNEMIKFVKVYGLTHHKTIQISQKLDRLLNLNQSFGFPAENK